MSCATVVKFEYRCTKCWQIAYAAVEDAGTCTICRNCGAEQIIPEASVDRIERAANVPDEALYANSYEPAEPEKAWTDAEIRQEVKRQMHVDPSEMTSFDAIAASRLKRFLGMVVDTLLLIGAIAGGMMLMFALGHSGYLDLKAAADPQWTIHKLNVFAVMYFIPIALILFQWNMIAGQGQTIGKWLLRMRIVTVNGQNPGFLQGVVLRNWVRAALNMLPGFGLLDSAMILGEQKRCLHDYIAGTHVIDVM